jgi:tellurite resistance protein
MPKEQAVRARKDRNAALVEAMVLAAAADGKVSSAELETLLTRVIERPEFEGTHSEELNSLVRNSAKTLASARSLDDILTSLRQRLPDHKNRMLAFGLAAAVAFADQRASRAELGLLKTFQAALGIAEDEVAQIVDVIEKGGSLAEALGEPLESLYAEVMVLVSASNGKIREAEARAMVESLVSDPLFADVSAQRAQGFITDSVAALASEGLPHRLQMLARGLMTHAQRLKAFRLAMRIANASGRPSAGELKILDLLQATFGIADDEVETIRRHLS